MLDAARIQFSGFWSKNDFHFCVVLVRIYCIIHMFLDINPFNIESLNIEDLEGNVLFLVAGQTENERWSCNIMLLIYVCMFFLGKNKLFVFAPSWKKTLHQSVRVKQMTVVLLRAIMGL